ncbi:50S ribosomal protein L27 [Patescibacteria group bacterium]|nr:50S ribosomal protein L27 [Patescibacteria group bacterium]MBU4016667.1 50S ribosomal protein L27 [Patescibacteria group bacterium]MBU4099541.1 50S ribosomal protein L27 [Patescibacteria group bacterium]
MAHTKAQGSVAGNRDSRPKYLGVKLYGGEKAINGNIIVRQRGSRIHGGKGVSMGKDFTLYAVADGKIQYRQLRGRKIVEVINE